MADVPPGACKDVVPRVEPEQRRDDSAPEPRPTDLLRAAIAFGAAVGLLELALLFVLKPLKGDPSPGLFRMNRHVLWIVPASSLLLFGGAGALLALWARVRPRLASRAAHFLFSFLAILTLLLTYRRLYAWASLLLAVGLGYRLGRRIGRHPAGFRRLIGRSWAVVGALALLVVGGAFYRLVIGPRGPAPGPLARPDAPNVLLIVLDTVRADRLSAYGYGRPTSPHLDRMAEEGVRFDWARSAAPWTLPSHATLMTGRWPHQHGAALDTPLDTTYPTLAEFLAARGYETAGFVANIPYTAAETGIDRGFSRYDDHPLGPGDLLRASSLGDRLVGPLVDRLREAVGRPGQVYPRKEAEEVGEPFLDWLARRPKGRPFFAFLNYLDAHNPYIPPRDCDHHFGEVSESDRDEHVLLEWFVLDKQDLSSREHRLAEDGYDDCIAYLDDHLGRLFGELKRRGIWEETLVIVTSDHGEHFGEHGLYGHASSLYDQEVHVPLLVAGPVGVPRGRAIDRPVTLRDLPTTVADLLGFAAESPFPGRSLARHWAPDAPPPDGPDDPLLSEVDRPAHAAPNLGRSPVFRGSMKSLVDGDLVYVRNGDGVEELYNVATDPAQARDLSGSEAARPKLDDFRERFRRMMEEGPDRGG